MAIRYGNPDLKISFESFVSFMLRVEIMGGMDVTQHVTDAGLQSKSGAPYKAIQLSPRGCKVQDVGLGSLLM